MSIFQTILQKTLGIITDKRFLITLGIIFIIYIYLGLFSSQFSKYLDTNWHNIRCKPYIIPIAGISKRASGTNFFNRTFNNFNECSHSIIGETISTASAPILSVIHGFTEIFTTITNIINKFRTAAKIMRDLFKTLVESVIDKASNLSATLHFYIEKLKLIMRKQTALFSLVHQFSGSLGFLMYSLVHGPIPNFITFMKEFFYLFISVLAICLLCAVGGPFVDIIACPLCAICFHPNSTVYTENGEKFIGDIELGEQLYTGKVVCTFEIQVKDYPLYNYDGILVTGDHLVKENGKWIRVHDSSIYRVSIKYTGKLYCLNTSDNMIAIKGHTEDRIFRDFIETLDPIVTNTSKIIYRNSLNRETGKLTSGYQYLHSIGLETLVRMNDGTTKAIRDVQIGDKLFCEIEVIGKVLIDIPNIEYYLLDGMILSGTDLIENYGKYIFVKDHIMSIPIYGNSLQGCHLITDMGLIPVGKNYFIRDYTISQNEKTNNDLDSLVENFLNFNRL